MIIYKDLLTGDEMVSNSYPLKEVDGAVYEVDCALISEGGITVDIDANNSTGEGEEEIVDDVRVNNLICSFRLQSTTFDKKSYIGYLKGYMKSVKSKLQELGKDPEYINDFTNFGQAYVKSVLLPNFENYEFYTGESQDPDGMMALLSYREDGTPYMIFWKHGLGEMKF